MTINYSIVLPFEKDFDPIPSTIWMQNNWYCVTFILLCLICLLLFHAVHLSIRRYHSLTLSFLYVVSIYWGRNLMATRQAFKCDGALRLWNTMLAVFSIFGMCRVAPEFYHVLTTYGLQYSMCSASYAQGVTGFWVEMFAFSKVGSLLMVHSHSKRLQNFDVFKVLEFGDTLFIVLRKRPLIFLHWYHHITVLMYTWHAYQEHCAAGLNIYLEYSVIEFYLLNMYGIFYRSLVHNDELHRARVHVHLLCPEIVRHAFPEVHSDDSHRHATGTNGFW